VNFNKHTGALIAFCFAFGSPQCHAQQGQAASAASAAIPTLDALPHKPLPHSDFGGWCGEGGKVLLMIKGDATDIYDGEVKASPLTFPTSASVQCANDGRTLVFHDDEAGSISEVDIAAGVVTRTLATYDKKYGGAVSVSPDLRNVVSPPLTFVSKDSGLNVIPSRFTAIHRFKWNRDSSAVLGTMSSKDDDDTVQIYDVRHRTIASGRLPAGFFFTDGWFADSRTLYLHLTPVHDEFGAGFMFRCTIVPWKCRQFASNVLNASVGGNGVLALVRAVGKYSNDGETEKYPPKYIAEIRSNDSKVLTRQTFKSAERDTLALSVDPSGTRAVFTWYKLVACPPGTPEGKLCDRKEGIMIDLSVVLK
jgi:hypothetical protein